MHTSPNSRHVWHATMRLYFLRQVESVSFWNHGRIREQVVRILEAHASRSQKPEVWWSPVGRPMDTEQDSGVPDAPADRSLPDTVPPNTEPWYTALVNVWNRKREAAEDKRLSRRPEWFAKTSQIPGQGKSFLYSDRSEILAMWRPAQCVSTLPDTLRRWWQFWEDAHSRVWKWDDGQLIPIVLRVRMNFTGYSQPNPHQIAR